MPPKKSNAKKETEGKSEPVPPVAPESDEINLDEIFEIAKQENIRIAQKKVEMVEKGLRKADPSLLNKWADETISNKINEILKSDVVNEVEVSFGTFGDNKAGFSSFVSGVSFKEFNRLKNDILSRYPDLANAVKETSEFRFQDARKILSADGSVEYQRKHRLKENQVNIPNWGVRISGSREEVIKVETMTAEKRAQFEAELAGGLVRQKRRWSFVIPVGEGTGPFNGFTIDMTEVHYPQKNETVYEIELEVMNRGDMTSKKMHVAVALAYIIMQETRVAIPPGYKELIVGNYNSLFVEKGGHMMYDARRVYRLENKPLPLTLESLAKGGDYYVTPKFDGERRRLFFDVNGVFVIGDDGSIKQITGMKDVPEYVGTIIDAEYMEAKSSGGGGGSAGGEKYYPFDCLVFQQENITTKPFEERKKAFESIKAAFIAQKPFFHEDNVFKSIKESFKWMDNHQEYAYDGFIAQPNADSYKEAATMKWKPLKMLTVDLRVVYEPDGKFFSVYMGTKQGEQIFRGNYNNLPFKYPTGILRQLGNLSQLGLGPGETLDRRIVEFSGENGKLKPYRLRLDKDIPNFITTVRSTWQMITRPITRDDLLGNTLKIYREHANNVKRQLIEKYVPRNSVVLDIGSGRGGDLAKWRDPEMVFGVDPDESNIREFRKRLENAHNKNAFKVENIGAEETDKVLAFLGERRPNVITSFFSLTFFPKSKAKLEGLISTIDKALARGGRFVGVTMDGDRTREKLELTEDNKIDTPLYSITQETEFDDNPVGNEITIDLKEKSTMVHAQTEYLVYFNNLVDRLKQIGIKLIDSKFLDDGVTSMPKVLLDFAHLNRTFVFQRDAGAAGPEVVITKGNANVGGSSSGSKRAEGKKPTPKIVEEDEVLVEKPDDGGEGEGQGDGQGEKEDGDANAEPSANAGVDAGGEGEEETAEFVANDEGKIGSLRFRKTKRVRILESDFDRVGVIRGNNSFFHSVYYLMGKNYREMFENKDDDANEGAQKAVHEYICQQRAIVAKKITKELFEQLIGGNVAHNIAYDLLFSAKNIKTSQKAKDAAYEKYKKMIDNCEEWVGAEIALYFAEKMKVNIHIIDFETRQKIQSSTVDDAKYDIAIMRVDELSYEPLVFVNADGEKSFRAPENF